MHVLPSFENQGSFNSLSSGDAYLHHCFGSSLVLVMADSLFDTQSLPELMIIYCPMDWQCKATSVKFQIKIWQYSFQKMWLKIRYSKYQPFCLNPNEKIYALKTESRNDANFDNSGGDTIGCHKDATGTTGADRVGIVTSLGFQCAHYSDIIMGTMTFQITGVLMVCLIVCSGTDQGKHQSSASLAFVRGIHRWLVNSPHKGPVTRKMFPFDDVIMKKYIQRIPGRKIL